MVKNIVNAIVEQMEKENLLNIEMKEYFTYSIAMIIEKWITIISVLFVGGIFKQTVQMMLFLFLFKTSCSVRFSIIKEKDWWISCKFIFALLYRNNNY